MSAGPGEKTWLTRDHVLVVQAARAYPTEPLFAERLWLEAANPMAAALQLLDLLIRERAVTHE